MLKKKESAGLKAHFVKQVLGYHSAKMGNNLAPYPRGI